MNSLEMDTENIRRLAVLALLYIVGKIIVAWNYLCE